MYVRRISKWLLFLLFCSVCILILATLWVFDIIHEQVYSALNLHFLNINSSKCDQSSESDGTSVSIDLPSIIELNKNLLSDSEAYDNANLKCCKGDDNFKSEFSASTGLGTSTEKNQTNIFRKECSFGGYRPFRRNKDPWKIDNGFINLEKSESDLNVMYALYWLRDHQDSKQGCWHADSIKEQCETNSEVKFIPEFPREGVCSETHNADSNTMFTTPGLTALAIHAFLGAGFSHEEGPFKLTIKKALRYLQVVQVQEDNGCFGSAQDENIILTQALCTFAISEAYAMTAVAKFRTPTFLAAEYLINSQNFDSNTGWSGWGYMPNDGKSNTFVTALVIQALKSAKLVQVKVPDRCFEGAEKFLNSVTSHPTLDKTEDKYPRTSFETIFSSSNIYEKLPTMDAMNIFCRRLMGNKSNDGDLMWQSEFIAYSENGNLPTIENPEKIDFLYWNWASLAMFQMGDNYWNLWKKQAYDSIIKLQRLEDENACAYGSWDPIDAWGSAGGRVYATAINALTLETEYRYKFIGR